MRRRASGMKGAVASSREELAMGQGIESRETHALRAARCRLTAMLLVLSTVILLAASLNA